MSMLDLKTRILNFTPGNSNVLDVGAGMGFYHCDLLAKTPNLTLLDAHQPYLDERLKKFPQVLTINRQALGYLQDTLFYYDVILGIDFLEHLDKPEAMDVVYYMRHRADRVALFVPEGVHPQDRDAYGMGDDHWQTHRSTWYAGDMEALGFTVEVLPSFHGHLPGKDPGALWCEWRK